MKGDTKYCEHHGEYVHEGESDECPMCAYYTYVNSPEAFEWEEEDDNSYEL
jgi:hypothetical protein